MKLYFSPAYCSLAVHIALRASGQPFTLTRVDTVAARAEDGTDFRTINPRGYVPVLELDDGSRHTEVAALLQHVGDAAPDSGLMPPSGSRERFEVLQWLTFISSELHKSFSPWLFHQDTADSTRSAVKQKIRQRLRDLDDHLAARDWLAGGRFTVADAYAFTILRWAPMVGMSLGDFPRLPAYLGRIAALPAVHAALLAEGLVRA
ncbi:MAG TPA: glutathione transferase GstA [Ramlibacter sp.]|jgi:glutathione S-transferase|uniref:glutathione transferase GstA n=1 Tax=Ramlibacter sp. TaxID=1917967 RepID=UPI002D6FACE7|nr:glutathione transferase GstA [Ramlibacter sp.]HZY17758.1 glutathione transferase GstA [Ramlibacter sp.]